MANPKYSWTQADRTGSAEDPFERGGSELIVYGLPTGANFPWPINIDSFLVGPSGESRKSIDIYQGDVYDPAEGIYGPVNITLRSGNVYADNTEPVYWHLTLKYAGVLVPSPHTEIRYVRANCFAGNCQGDVPEPDPNGDGDDGEAPPDATIKIFCAEDIPLMITEAQRDASRAAGDLALVWLSATLYKWVTPLTPSEFLARYPYDAPEPELILSFPDPTPDPDLGANRWRVVQVDNIEMHQDLHAGGQIRKLYLGDEQILWGSGGSNVGGAIQIDMLLANNEKAHGSQDGPWKDDPIKSQLMPTQGGPWWGARHVPVNYGVFSNGFSCTTQLVDFWSYPAGEKYLTKFYCTMIATLVANQLLIELQVWHQYDSSIEIGSYSIWFYPEAKELTHVVRSDGTNAYVTLDRLRMYRPDDTSFLLLADGPPYIAAWLTGAEGEPEGIEEIYTAQKPNDAYTLVSGKRWFINKEIQPNAKLGNKMVISLDGNSPTAQAVYDGTYEEEEPNDIHKLKAGLGTIARSIVQYEEALARYQRRSVIFTANDMTTILDDEMENPSLDKI